MRNFSCLLAISLLVACSDSPHKAGGQAKKAGPKHPKMLTTKPSNATSAGTASSVQPPNGTGNGQSLSVPGGGTSDTFSWQAAIDDSGSQAQCVGAFAADGSAAVACGPLTSTCDDGSELDAGLLLFFDAGQNQGAFAIVGSDLCGEGYDLVGCTFDGDGNIGDCGTGDIANDQIEISTDN